MTSFVVDTLALVLYLEKRQMPETAKKYFLRAENAYCALIVPSIVMEEIEYLHKKHIIDLSLARAEEYINNFATIRECPLDAQTMRYTYEITDIVPLHDRLIAGMARCLNLPILTNSIELIESKFVQTWWN